MGFFFILFLFCLTTAITAMYELYSPVVRDLALLDSLCVEIRENRALAATVFFLISFSIAPLVLLACLVPSWGQRFRETLYTTFSS